MSTSSDATAAPDIVASLLRADPDALNALCSATAEATGLPLEFVEKDYWATEALRAATSVAVSKVEQVVFKGGTSLSKAFGLIQRFSEDVDLIVVIEEKTSKNARKQALRTIAGEVTGTLGVEHTRVVEGSGFLNARYGYPATTTVVHATSGVLLEMGTRGGPYPNETRSVRSLVSEHAAVSDPASVTDFSDLAPFEVTVLAPERTLAEKLAFLHHRASVGDGEQLARGARHLYDVACLVNDDTIRDRLKATPIAELMVDVDARSEAVGWGFTPRPSDGFAASPAFDPAHPTAEALRAGYEQVGALVWGDMPTFDEALAIIVAHGALL